MSSENTAIQLDRVGKTFRRGFWGRKVAALNSVSMAVPKGSLFGYIGHNGAGKTTTIKMLLGLIAPGSGRVSVWGGSPAEVAIRRRVGYLPEQPYFYDYLSASEFLTLHAKLCGIAPEQHRHRIDELLDRVGLTGVGSAALNGFSKGMLQRIGLAQALIGDPDLVILDEPMSGLDPAGRKTVRDIMLDLKQRGKTVFFSTHVLADAEAICDQVAILVRGEIRSVGPLSELLSPKVTGVEVVTTGLAAEFVVPVGTGLFKGGVWHIQVSEQDSGTLLKALLAAGGAVVSVTPHRESLESLFMSELTAVERAG